ncbi:hypothetical protein LguiB_019269 [Lonicera macranthoides]
MGVIKDGTISGVLPSTKAFLVHYPGYPSSIARAVETLGGSEGIAKARSSQSNKLELHFRPEDPYSHPAFGELFPCNKFLLKISRQKNGEGRINVEKNISCPELMETAQVSQPDASTEVEVQRPNEVPEELFADVIASVSEAYHFNGMVDYQHVPAVHADAARKKKRNWADVEPQFEKRGLMDVDQEDLMIILPPLFSLKDMPEKVVLKPSVDVGMKKKQDGVVQQRWEMEIEPSLAIDYYIKDVPKPVSWQKYIPEGSDQWEWQMAVCKLFDERPIWVKYALIERLLDKGLQFGGTMLRRLLFRTAYYFSNGPFLRFWIKKGYDPRKDPESRIYQRIDFRVPPPLRSHWESNMASELKHRWEDICAFRVFPQKFQISLQLFELGDDYIQQEIRKPSNQETCSCATGWFSARVLDTLRLCVAVRFLSIYPEAGAKSLLKSTSERFEKSKKMLIFAKNNPRPEGGQHQVNKESVVNEDNGPNDNDDDEEEDEIEDYNAEDELDAYEELEMAGEDGSFSPQQSSYTDRENISRNYLQDLFGSFPFSDAAGGTAFQDADISDGEYEIYEQYNGNSDDDDY